MYDNYDYRWGYDFDDHLAYIQAFVKQWSMPSILLSRAAYHPPLYYAIAAFALKHGLSIPHLGIISIICGCVRLGLIWAGLEIYLPRSRFARLVALGLAAVFYPSIHLEGMTSGEGLSCVLSAALLLIAPSVLRRSEQANPPLHRPWLLAALAGVIAGLALLTKVSALAIIGALGFAVVYQSLAHKEGGSRARILRLAPWLVALSMFGLTAGWYLEQNHRLHGKWFLSGFDGREAGRVTQFQNIPIYKRRNPAYYVGWTNDIYKIPYYPSGVSPTSYFWPQMVATTFVDYFNYRFSRAPNRGEAFVPIRVGLIRTPVMTLSRLSAAGGTILVIAVMAAWLNALVHVLRRRESDRLALLLAPAVALAGQLYFAVTYPIDSQGMVKGLYMQFAAPPLYALVGLAAAWCWQRRQGKPLGLIVLFAVALTGAYSVYCRCT